MPIRKPGEKASRFDQSVEDVNPHLRIAELENVEGDPIVARPIALDKIAPDPRQPRRAIPTAVRAVTPNGSPADLLETWRQMATKSLGWATLDPTPIIMGTRDAIETDDATPLAANLLTLYGLAGSILKDGLLNPITVAPAPAGGYIIETGERRYLAYTLLNQYVDAGRYGKIPAQRMDTHDAFRQAVENTNRSALTAIEKARQLALLYMAMYPDETFKPFEDCITPDGSDRPYYAQAVKLNSRRGEGQRILDAMGISNRSSITMYKKLLTLTDEQWIEGDARNASLNELLMQIDEVSGTSYGRTNDANANSYVYHDKHNDPDPTPRESAPVGWKNPQQNRIPLINPEPDHSVGWRSGVTVPVDRNITHNGISTGRPTPSHVPVTPVTPPTRPWFQPGDHVQHESGRYGTVTAAHPDGNLTVQFTDGETVTWLRGGFTKTPPPATSAPGIDEYTQAVVAYVQRVSGQSPDEVILIRDTDPPTWEFMCQQYDASKSAMMMKDEATAPANPLHNNDPATYAALDLALFLVEFVPPDGKQQFRAMRDAITAATTPFLRDELAAGTTPADFETALREFEGQSADAVDTYFAILNDHVNNLINVYKSLAESES